MGSILELLFGLVGDRAIRKKLKEVVKVIVGGASRFENRQLEPFELTTWESAEVNWD